LMVASLWTTQRGNRYVARVNEELKRNSREMRKADIATVIERDLLHTEEKIAKHTIIKCFSCGRSHIYDGWNDDGMFCSEYCREWYDNGNPGFLQDWRLTPAATNYRITGLRLIAGPPDKEMGADYYRPVRDAFDAPRQGRRGEQSNDAKRRGRSGVIIRCATCADEFESLGLRCCSVKCEAELKKRNPNRKRRPKKLPYYKLKMNGRAIWEPSKKARGLGYKVVNLGIDGPEAWAKAGALNEAVRQGVPCPGDTQKSPENRASNDGIFAGVAPDTAHAKMGAKYHGCHSEELNPN
jgi:hypothetical protein